MISRVRNDKSAKEMILIGGQLMSVMNMLYRWESDNGDDLRKCDKDDRYHALEWWMYGLTQQCSWTDAKALLGRMLVRHGLGIHVCGYCMIVGLHHHGSSCAQPAQSLVSDVALAQQCRFTGTHSVVVAT